MTYWILSVVLVVFGFLTGFSIGAPFLLIGLTLLVLGPVRRRRRIFVPVLMAVAGFCVGYALVTPLTCTAREAVGGAGAAGGAADVSCTSILGGPYRGTGAYDPPREPALLAGLSTAAGAGIVAWLALTVPRARRASRPDGS